MQTFLPFPSFSESAKCLDRLRLGKQRVECLQIAKTLLGDSQGWSNHPAVRMWQGYELALLAYWEAVVTEWTSRGYRDSTLLICREMQSRVESALKLPQFIGNDDFHRSHQSNLLRKDSLHYSQYFPADVPNDLAYVWPGMSH